MERALCFLKKYAPAVLFIALILLVDQLVKNWAVASLPGNRITVIENVFYLTFATNSGAAWNLLSGSRGVLLLVSIAAFGLIFYIFKAGWITTAVQRWCMYAVIGGALGNLFDRIFRPDGLVIDLFDFQLIHFPIFNVADIFISVGGVLFILCFLRANLHGAPLKPDSAGGTLDIPSNPGEDRHDQA